MPASETGSPARRAIGVALICAPAAAVAMVSISSVLFWGWLAGTPIAAAGGWAIGRWWAVWITIPAALTAVVIVSLTYTPEDGESDWVTWAALAMLIAAASAAAVTVGVLTSRSRNSHQVENPGTFRHSPNE
jgi:hypothetical protein